MRMPSPTFSVARSLKRKLLLPLLLIGAALATATVWGIYAKSQQQLAGKLRQRAELIANAVNYAAESVPHRGELQRIVTAIGAEEEVSLIVVVGGRPARVLATTRNAWLGKTLTELPAKEVAEDLEKVIQSRQSHHHLHLAPAQFDFTSPLLLSQPELADRSLTDGAVMVHLDTRPTQAAIRQLTLEFSSAFLAALAILAALGYGLIHHFVLRPISRIGKLVEHRREDAGESWAGAATDDELGALARTLHDSLTRTDALLHDLEEQKDTLRDSQALYQSLVTQLPQCIFRKDLEGRFTFANQHFSRLLGKTPAEIQGRTDFDFFPRDLAEKYRRDDLCVMQERRVWEQVEENALPNGERVFVQIVKTPLVNAAGDVVGVQGIFWDITERKRVEAERELLVAELRSALARVKTLSGLVPICAVCKKIRDDKNYWHQVDAYIAQHTDATFTHGMCPDCIKKWYPQL